MSNSPVYNSILPTLRLPSGADLPDGRQELNVPMNNIGHRNIPRHCFKKIKIPDHKALPGGDAT